MRYVLLPLVALGALLISAAPAHSQGIVAPAPAITAAPVATVQTTVTPVRWVYRYPGWYGGGYAVPYGAYYGPPAVRPMGRTDTNSGVVTTPLDLASTTRGRGERLASGISPAFVAS